MARLPRRISRFARTLAVAALTWTLAGLVTSVPAQAAELPVQLSAKPVGQPGQYFDLTLGPGQTRQLKIALGNHGTAPITARAYAADVYTIINGGFGAVLRDGTTAGTATWLDYPTEVLTLRPGRATVRAFSVTVPRGTPAGEYIASVILENDEPVKGKGSIALDQVVRQAVAVAVRVPGTLQPGLAIGAASHKVAAERSTVAVDVRNTGNALLKPKAAILVHDDAGKVVSKTTVPMDSFYAHTDTKVEITLAQTLEPGHYTVDLSLDDAARDAHAEALGLPLTVTPPVVAQDANPSPGRQVIDVLQGKPGRLPVWVAVLATLGLGLALVGVGMVAALRRRRRSRGPVARRRRTTQPTQPRAPRPVPETLETLETLETTSASTVLPGVQPKQADGEAPDRVRRSHRAPKQRGRPRIGV